MDQQQALLDQVKADVPRGDPKYARKVIMGWWHRLYGEPPYLIENDGSTQTDWCQDCSCDLGNGPVEAEFYWKGWGGLCAVCSLRRFDQ